ncbi:MAG: acetyl-CoA carboxylase carboxyltransferase subunit alpha [Candidatus Bipolaricaulota bacterium]|nr:acetyl-CoA carboxylase carboxyltransferase subunit alpha [Candidatus Bipolaricaulota bacterium]MCS7274769.1 acetyl-CoA carboxylase carboxyltransferase subunit alpha [Candidatus Bipolaricaulota bacterium]MDW8110049.1 acetyl-CoA carboxylase carboxyltransferase subunit alpha [Candidatus Bipolaricaulota bacterium]MDW8329474.1 acetyl-CoA carboxylase carboxyltransferase subunit alpha [Candidatus Bipolaricaulota bacterium]
MIYEELERQIEQLRALSRNGVDLSEEIERLEAKLEALKKQIAAPASSPAPSVELDDWERVKLARHPKRPYALDYIQALTEDFYELHGDRLYGDDAAVVAGIARFDGQTVVIVGTQKGRDATENVKRNFGMPHPEGYRKALRVMKLGERFGFPILTLIDTPGAYPGVGAEERNIGGALAQNIYEMLSLKVPIVATIIGEGGSGGALALAIGDRVLMLENATYSVITPEGCAAILFRDATKAPEAARALKLTAPHLLRLGVIDEIVPEPPGGAHLDPEMTMRALRGAWQRHLRELLALPAELLPPQRREKFQKIGVYEEIAELS